MRLPFHLPSFLILFIIGCQAVAQSAEFIPLGFHTDTIFTANPLAVSEDGSVVVGAWGFGPLTTWTKGEGTTVLADNFAGVGLSGDGSIVVTTQRISNPPNPQDRAVRIEAGTPESFASESSGRVISQDGSTIIAHDHERDVILRWTDDEAEPLFDSDFGPTAISADGAIIVGSDPLFRWSSSDGFQELSGTEHDIAGVSAFGLSSDGRWTVGAENRQQERTQFRALRWQDLSLPEQLLPSNATWGTSAKDVTADGGTVVGRIYLADENLERRADLAAGVWTEESGVMEPLQDLLISQYGLGDSLEDYHLTGVYDVTDDGRFMVGHMINPEGLDEAFLVDLGPIPEPQTVLLLGIATALLGWHHRLTVA